jgi:predicted RNA binding protein YcfA (HicA-like mRNA interferase family)
MVLAGQRVSRSSNSPPQEVFGNMVAVPRKVRQLVSDLERAGFRRVSGGKGSHRKFVHPKFRGFVLISGHDGDDAMPYLEKHVKRALQQVQE